MGLVVRYVAALLVGLALFRLFPALRAATPHTGSEVLIGLGIGALLLIAVPAVAVAATVTLVGAPLGIITLLTWLVCMYLAGVVVAEQLGRLILDEAKHGSLQPLLLGLAVVLVVVNLPFVGGLLRLLVVALGLGLLGQQLYRSWHERPGQGAFE